MEIKSAIETLEAEIPEPFNVTGLSGNDREEYLIKAMHVYAKQFIEKADILYYNAYKNFDRNGGIDFPEIERKLLSMVK